jgi:hypothetical protein
MRAFPSPGDRGFIAFVRALAAALAFLAAICLTVAIAGMVTGRPGAKAGFVIRVVALGCFVAAVVLNVTAR